MKKVRAIKLLLQEGRYVGAWKGLDPLDCSVVTLVQGWIEREAEPNPISTSSGNVAGKLGKVLRRYSTIAPPA